MFDLTAYRVQWKISSTSLPEGEAGITLKVLNRKRVRYHLSGMSGDKQALLYTIVSWTDSLFLHRKQAYLRNLMILTCRGTNSWYLNLSMSFALAIGFSPLRKSKILSQKKDELRIEALCPYRFYLWSFMFSSVVFYSYLKARFKTGYSRGKEKKIK